MQFASPICGVQQLTVPIDTCDNAYKDVYWLRPKTQADLPKSALKWHVVSVNDASFYKASKAAFV